MGEYLNIKVEVIPGYSKGYGFKAGDTFEKTNHAWNAVLINNKWSLLSHRFKNLTPVAFPI